MTTNREKFATTLRNLRQERGFAKARHFAQALGIPENRYTRYERGDSEPDLDDIYQFLEKLPASPNELFGFEGVPTAPGFASGPQAPLTRSVDDDSGGVGQTSQLPINTEAADAAAWRLAATIVSHRSGERQQTGIKPHFTLAELREIGRLFTALRSDPYDTLARLVTEPTLQIMPGPAVNDVEDAVALYTSTLS